MSSYFPRSPDDCASDIRPNHGEIPGTSQHECHELYRWQRGSYTAEKASIPARSTISRLRAGRFNGSIISPDSTVMACGAMLSSPVRHMVDRSLTLREVLAAMPGSCSFRRRMGYTPESRLFSCQGAEAIFCLLLMYSTLFLTFTKNIRKKFQYFFSAVCEIMFLPGRMQQCNMSMALHC